VRRHTGTTAETRLVKTVPTSLLERRRPPIERLHHDGLRIAASFEFFPPKTPELAARLRDTADQLHPLHPEFVSVTFGAGGTTRERTVETVIDLAKRGFNTAAHLTCVGSSRDEIHELARVYREAGISHVVALRGDWPDGIAAPGSMGVPHASDLVRLLRESGFTEISVAAFPEGHPESDFSLRLEIENLKRKADAGATRAITQFVFDNAVYLRFVDRAQAAGIEIPIVPGILPITDLAVVRGFAARVGASVPDWLDPLFEGLDDDLPGRELVAASLAAEQSADLTTHGVRHVHFYTLNRANLTRAVCRLLRVGSGPEPARAVDAEAQSGRQEADQRG
jgi:methylenetetrahydrofolate reductase (NADPH)